MVSVTSIYASTPALILFTALVSFTLYSLLLKKSRKKQPPLPPGPRGLPLVGNLPFLDPNLHTYCTKLAKTYGPIYKLQFGRRLCVVLNIPSIVEEIHKFHDIILSNHDQIASAVSLTSGTMTFSLYGENWKMMRKIAVQELLSSKRLDSLYDTRRNKVREMVNKIYLKTGQPVNIREYVVIFLFQLLTNILWGGTLEKEDKEGITNEFVKVMDEVFKLVGLPNVSDFFPVLAKFDLQGLERKMRKNVMWLDRLLDDVISQRLRVTSGGKLYNGTEKDFLQVLLQIKEQGDHKEAFTMIQIKALLRDLLVAGGKTSSTTIEWVMALLMKHPEKMQKLQDEIKEIVGMDNIVEESHLPQLKYLNAVVKEGMRLYPVAPLLIPRVISESCVVGGYQIPKGAKVIVNAWAIQRDPESWEDPLEFKPERFLNAENKYDFNGKSFKFIPFGGGRRVCVAIPLVERMVPYVIASIMHSFDWKMPNGEEVDLSESFGLELTKTIPLVAIPEARLSDSSLYN